MPEVALKLQPTVNAEFTESLNQAGISSCQFIRFKAGLPQKLGGWQKFFQFAVDGIPYSLHPWQDLNANDWLGVGATEQLSVILAGTAGGTASLTDITPQTLLSNNVASFSTTAGTTTVTVSDSNFTQSTAFDSVFFNTPISVGGIVLTGLFGLLVGGSTYQISAAIAASATVTNGGVVPEFTASSASSQVTVVFPNHDLSVGETFTFPIPTSFAGVTIGGNYPVLTVPGTNTFTISASTIATTNGTAFMNGGLAQLLYYINLGPAQPGTGYGIGGYGIGGYGVGTSGGGVTTGAPITATDWTLDNWGQILLANPFGGGIFQWQPSSGFSNASIIPTAPPFNNGIFVAMPEQILVAYGSTNTAGQQDPMLVKWSDQSDFTVWDVQVTNQAGSFRLPRGSKIVGGLQGPQQALLWTDLAVWSMAYIAGELVFGFNEIATGCGLIGPHAVAVLRGNVYWMGTNNFFAMTSGGIAEIPCTVWDVVFQNLDTANQHKCVAASNSSFDEIWFFFPSQSGGTGECDTFVKFNVTENSWDYSSLARSAWTDQSVLGQPIGAAPTGLIYQHETGFDNDTLPMSWFFETGYFTISEGNDLAFVDWFFPDMKWGFFNGSQNATVLVTIIGVDYPNGPQTTYGPFTMSAAVTFVVPRVRNRQVKFLFQGNDQGTFARLGLMRYRAAQDGRR